MSKQTITQNNVISGIYQILNKINNKIYIGSSLNISERKYNHYYHLYKLNHHSKHLQSAWNKYGAENFEFKVIEFAINKGYSLKEFDNYLRQREDYYIQKLKPEYNCSAVGHTTTGADFYKSEEHRNKFIGKKNGMFNIHRFGKDNPMFGKKSWSNGKTKKTDNRLKIISKKMSNIMKQYYIDNPDKKPIGNKNPMFGMCGGKNPFAKPIVQLTLDGKLVREYDYIKEVEKLGFCWKKVSECVNHKYISKLGDNVYGKRGKEKYIWIDKERYYNEK